MIALEASFFASVFCDPEIRLFKVYSTSWFPSVVPWQNMTKTKHNSIEINDCCVLSKNKGNKRDSRVLKERSQTGLWPKLLHDTFCDSANDTTILPTFTIQRYHHEMMNVFKQTKSTEIINNMVPASNVERNMSNKSKSHDMIKTIRLQEPINKHMDKQQLLCKSLVNNSVDTYKVNGPSKTFNNVYMKTHLWNSIIWKNIEVPHDNEHIHKRQSRDIHMEIKQMREHHTISETTPTHIKKEQSSEFLRIKSISANQR